MSIGGVKCLLLVSVASGNLNRPGEAPRELQGLIRCPEGPRQSVRDFFGFPEGLSETFVCLGEEFEVVPESVGGLFVCAEGCSETYGSVG